MRAMSFRLTEEAFKDGSKTVTRRAGWRNLQPGTKLRAVRQVMGLPKGSKHEVWGTIEVVSVRRERLDAITDDDVEREGFAGRNAAWFVAFFCRSMRCKPETEVTRIEFRRVQ